MHKKSMPQPKKFTMRLPKFCLKKRTRMCEFKTFWTKAVLQEARFTHITKRKRNCSNPYVRPYSDTSFPTRLQRKKPRFFKILHIRLQALYHAHFYHLHDEKTLVHAILLSQSKDTFLNYLRGELAEFATACVENNFVTGKNLPKSLKVNSVIENFVLLVEYWNSTAFTDTPERLTEYFLIMNE